MSPASKNEYAKITECYTRIGFIERQLKELKEDLRKQTEQEIEKKRYVSNKRLAIYLAIASILGGIMLTIVERLIDLIM